MILKPAWKLLNFHLPIFTEVLGYNQPITANSDEEPLPEDNYQRGYESEDEDEAYGVEGMTLQLLELLTTLISRQNVQEVVKQGLESPAHAAILNGDAARLEGFRDDYVTLKKLLQPLAEKLPIHIGLGNHDDRGNFFKEFSQQPDSKELVQGKHVSLFSLGGTRFVVLDSLLYVNKVAGLLGKSQRDWLEKFLGDDDQSPVVFFVHHTLGDNDGDLLDVDRLFKLLAPHKKVKAIFVGHAHIYQFDKREHIHLINLPAIGYNFSDAQPIGWMSGAFTPQGAELTLHTIGGNKDKDGEVTKLDWA